MIQAVAARSTSGDPKGGNFREFPTVPEPVARSWQISIADIATLTLGCALGFGAYRSITPRWAMIPGRAQLLVLVYNSGMSLAFGVIFAGVFALARRRKREDRESPLPPGHWLLLFGMFASLADLVAVVVFYALDAYWSRPVAHFDPFWIILNLGSIPYLPAIFHQVAGWGLGAVFASGFSWWLSRRLRRAWLLVFVAFDVVASILTGAAVWAMIALSRGSEPSWVFDSYREWAITLYRGSIIGCLLAIGLAVALDLRDQLQGDVLHWAGITAWLLVGGLQWILY